MSRVFVASSRPHDRSNKSCDKPVNHLQRNNGTIASMKIANVYLHFILAVIAFVAAESLSVNKAATSRRRVAQLIGSSSLALLSSQLAAADDESTNISEEERSAVLQRLKDRRQLMQASRSTSNRQDYLDLSRQRAKLYNTTSKAWSCPPNIPCI